MNGVITAANHREVGPALDEITITDELRKYGYSTGIFGKWHLGYAPEFNPTLQGFDEFKGFVSDNVDYHAHIDQEGYFDWWSDLTLKNDKGYTSDLITRYGIEFIRKNNPRLTGKPFFLYLPHESPHYPFQRRKDDPVRKVGVKGRREIARDSIPPIYKEMVEVLDEFVEVILQTLKETDLDNNTIVLFCSDNGASRNGSNGVLRGNKSDVYEGGHRVPAIAWHPSFSKTVVCDEPVLTMDLLPPFLEFIGNNPESKSIDGISIKNLLLSEEKLPRRDLFWSFKNRNAIRSGSWKLVSWGAYGADNIELYNLSKDIGETVNVAHSHQGITERLKRKLLTWLSEVEQGVEVISQ